MRREEAEDYAKNMSYRDAIHNALQGKCIPYRKATLIKLYELLDMIEPCEDCISRKAVLDKINEVCFSNKQEWVDFRVSYGSHGERDLIIDFIESLSNVQQIRSK